jgi:hypothetical protein
MARYGVLPRVQEATHFVTPPNVTPVEVFDHKVPPLAKQHLLPKPEQRPHDPWSDFIGRLTQ